ncbi:type II toxin-antitoxin system RelE/ParE family toxin [Natronogracilivirgula saccharolytica]|uniref:Type II toxin-antitoxin system RelE/ParE family toxin n=1 Tax=Natronogracilivirga saccharolytica TaxID=2812953 RepID=A0A8J7UWX6_9BACT|nr:type II toxin-antitoxin system RelE/ParE family toxin [Natronogracilivirga saccharolytica]
MWEVRIQSGSNIFRLLGFWYKGKIIILTNGFTKKSQKTPKNEILIAEQRKTDFLSRKGDNQ